MLASLLGVPFGSETRQDLFAPAREEHPAFFETLAGTLDYGWEPLFGVVLGNMKYIHSSRPELYDRERDPDELVNLVSSDPATAERLSRLVRDTFADDLAAVPAPTVDLGLEELERLQGLGYLGGGATEPASVAAALPPQAMMRYLTRVELAQDKTKPLDESIAELEAVLAERPDFYPAWKGLGNIHRRALNLEAAARALQRCIELRPAIPQTVFELALVRAHQQRTDDVLKLLAPIVQDYPSFVRVRYLFGSTLAGVRRFDEAIGHLRAVFDLDPDHERCLEHLVAAYMFAQRGEELLGVLEEHLATHPQASKVRTTLAGLYERSGKRERAAALRRKAPR
jgi:tetratricopeptide (TPR) repeat protein